LILHSGILSQESRRRDNKHKTSASILKEISFSKEILAVYEQLGNLLSLCREIAGARDILQKFENLKKQHEWNFNL
jgi:hypothetical protein